MLQFEYLDSGEYFENVKKHKNIVCFGAGAKLRQAFSLLKNAGIKPTVICDNNSALWGKTITYEGETIEIVSYDKIKKTLKDYIVLLTMAINNATEVYQFLQQQGEKNSIIQFCNPFKVDHLLVQSKDIENNLNDFQIIYDNLADDISRRLFTLNLNYKITGNMLDLYKMTDGNTFFDASILGYHTNAVYVDVGAYTGDTVLKYLEYCGGRYQHIYAFEADRGNFASLKKFVKYGHIDRITLFNQALWSEKSNLTFYSVKDNSEINYDSPNVFRSVDHAIDNHTMTILKNEGREYEQEEIQTEALDNILMQDNPTIIKVNALAADFQILKGCKNIIERCKPIIIMEHGVKPENILAVMFFLNSLRSDYVFYLRQKEIFKDSKTIMYAV